MATDSNPLHDPKLQNAVIDPKTQDKINAPLKDPTGVNAEDQAFVKMIVEKIENGDIKPLEPSSLINNEVYDKADEMAKGRIDYEAVSSLGTIRQIKDLWDLGQTESYQIQNLVHQLRISKERFEDVEGDVFII